MRLTIEILWVLLNAGGAGACIEICRRELLNAKKAVVRNPDDLLRIVVYQVLPLLGAICVMQVVFALWGVFIIFYSRSVNTQDDANPGFLFASAVSIGLTLLFDAALGKYLYDQERIKQRLALKPPTPPAPDVWALDTKGKA